jgi:SAM-dependent methyltransferase
MEGDESMEGAPEINEAERQRWNNARWAAVWPKRERLTDAVTAYVLDAAALLPAERVLDVGCGGGKTSIAAAHAVGASGAVVGADISVPLRALAEQRVREAGVGNVAFCTLDVQVDPVAGGPFDAAISQFGVMFFEEPVAAFGNIRGHLVADGRLVFACWQSSERNPWFFASAIKEFVPTPPELAPGKSSTGPFALADPERTAGILRSAGFVEIRRTPYDITVDAPRDSVVDDDQLVFMGIPDDTLPAARAAVDAHMQQFALTPELSRFPLAFQVFEARAS